MYLNPVGRLSSSETSVTPSTSNSSSFRFSLASNSRSEIATMIDAAHIAFDQRRPRREISRLTMDSPNPVG